MLSGPTLDRSIITLPYLTLTDSGIERPLGLEDPLSSSSDTVGTVRALYGSVHVVRPVSVKSRLELRDCGGGDVSRERIPIVHNSVAEGLLASCCSCPRFAGLPIMASCGAVCG